MIVNDKLRRERKEMVTSNLRYYCSNSVEGMGEIITNLNQGTNHNYKIMFHIVHCLSYI
jgi:predicted transcriptional regulator